MQLIFGIDVGKNGLDIYNSDTKKHLKIKNKYIEIEDFINSIKNKNKNEIVFFFEPTGVYCQTLIKCLNDREMNYYLIGLDTIYRVGNALGDRNKTDKIDSKKICIVGTTLLNNDFSGKSRLIKPVSNKILICKNILSNLSSLKILMVKTKVLLDNFKNQPFQEELQDIREFYENQIKSLEIKINYLNERLEIYLKELGYEKEIKGISKIPGLSKQMSVLLIVFFLDLINKGIKRDDYKKLKAYTGLDPNMRQSGFTLNKVRISRKGNKQIRHGLFFAGMVWWRNKEVEKYKTSSIGKFQERLIKNGKTTKQIICAVESKLIKIARAIFWDKSEYIFR